MSDKLVRIKNRYDTAKNWYINDPILAAGEIGIDSTHNHLKIGDGSTNFFNLPTLVNKVIDTGIITVSDKKICHNLDLSKIAGCDNDLTLHIQGHLSNSGGNLMEYNYGPNIIALQMFKSIDVYVEGYGEITIKLGFDVDSEHTRFTSKNFDYSVGSYNIHTLHSLTDANNDDCVYVITSPIDCDDYMMVYFYLTSVKPTEEYFNTYFTSDMFDDNMAGKKVRYRVSLN